MIEARSLTVKSDKMMIILSYRLNILLDFSLGALRTDFLSFLRVLRLGLLTAGLWTKMAL